jgi:hypothetical protein
MGYVEKTQATNFGIGAISTIFGFGRFIAQNPAKGVATDRN